jgi:hypothetical protein
LVDVQTLGRSGCELIGVIGVTSLLGDITN